MTVETSDIIAGPFIGNGVTTSFPRNFSISDPSHVQVTLNGVLKESGYLVVDPDLTSASIEFDSPPAAGVVIIITRNTPIRQSTDYSSQGSVSPVQIEDDLDYRTRVEQENRRDADRALKFPFGVTGDPAIPSLSDTQSMVWDADAAKFVPGPTTDAIGRAQADNEAAQQARLDAIQAKLDAIEARDAAALYAQDAALGGNVPLFVSVAGAAAIDISADIKRLYVQHHTPFFARIATLVGGAHYRRESLANLTGYPAQSYFRSVDRFMPDGSTDATNGGYWLIDEVNASPEMFGAIPGAVSTVSLAEQNANTVAVQAAFKYMELRDGVVDEGVGAACSWHREIVVGGRLYLQNEEGQYLEFGRLTAGEAFPLNKPILTMQPSAARSTVSLIIDGNRRAAGIKCDAGRAAIRGCFIHHFQDYGIEASSPVGGDAYITDNHVQQWDNSDAEFLLDTSYTADGIRVARADQKVMRNTVRWTGCNIRLKTGATTTLLQQNHLYNGGSGLLVRGNGKNIVVERGAFSTFILGNYIDNGAVDLFEPSVYVFQNMALHAPSAVSHGYFMRVYANGQTNPYQFQSGQWLAVSGVLLNGTVPFIEFVDYVGGTLPGYPNDETWSGDFTRANAVTPDKILSISDGAQAIISTSASNKPVLELISARPAADLLFSPTEDGYAGEGPILSAYRKGMTGLMDELRLYNPVSDVFNLGLGLLKKVGIGTVDGTNLTLRSNGQNMWELLANGVFRPIVEGKNIGAFGFRIGQMFAQTATNVSSDRRLKKDIQPITDKERSCAAEIRKAICKYRLKSDGENGQWRVGVIAQEAEAIMKRHGMNAADWGFIQKDAGDGPGKSAYYSIAYDDLQMLLLSVPENSK